jgi:hypothetical protein
MKNLIVLLVPLVMLFGCGDNDVDATNPNGGTLTTESMVWTQVNYDYLAPNPPSSCTSSEKFQINNDGTWTWDWCEQHKNGALTMPEIVQVNDRVLQVQAVGFVPEVCMELSFAGRVELRATFKPSAERVLHTIDRSGSCYRAPSSDVNALEKLVTDLRTKYAGFDVNP